MKNILGLIAYKKDGQFANRAGIIEASESREYLFHLRFKTGETTGFNSLNEITIVELGG